MLSPKKTSQFKKDYQKYQYSGRHDISKLNEIIRKLINEESIDGKHHNHRLKGKFSDFRECHIEPNWLLLYKIDGKYIIFTRTGSHSELFD